MGADFAYGQAQYLSAATAEANKALEDVKKLLDEAGVSTKTLVGEGHAIHEGVVRVAENVGADLIVMGSHGRRGLEKLVLGSVAQRVCKLRTFRCWSCARKRSACSEKTACNAGRFVFGTSALAAGQGVGWGHIYLIKRRAGRPCGWLGAVLGRRVAGFVVVSLGAVFVLRQRSAPWARQSSA